MSERVPSDVEAKIRAEEREACALLLGSMAAERDRWISGREYDCHREADLWNNEAEILRVAAFRVRGRGE